MLAEWSVWSEQGIIFEMILASEKVAYVEGQGSGDAAKSRAVCAESSNIDVLIHKRD